MSLPPQRYQDEPPEQKRRTSLKDVDLNWGGTAESMFNEDAQREQDLDAARLMSQANADIAWMDDEEAKLSTPHAAAQKVSRNHAVAAAAAASRQFYQQNAGSSTSVDSQNHFIDHRNQSHSLSVNPHSPLAARAMQGTSSMHDHPTENSPYATKPAPALCNQPVENMPPSNTPVPLVNIDSAASSWEPRVDGLNNLAQSTITDSSRPLEDDVCFPPPTQVDQPAVDSKHESSKYKGEKPGFPYTFDLSILEEFAKEERENFGNASSWPPASSFGSSARPGQGGQFGYTTFPFSGATNGDSMLYSRRPRRAQTSGMETGAGGSKYQKKLAMFEGGQSFGRAPDSKEVSALTSGIDSKNESVQPLLQGSAKTSYQGVPGSEARPSTLSRAQTIPRAPRSTIPIPGALHDKPYRFTFYSNAFPTSLHARFLSELPGPGQTFEDLIRGVPSDDPPEKPRTTGTSAGSQPLPQIPLMGHARDATESEANTWWLDVLCPTDQEMKILARTFGIHPLTTEDILMEETREKIELFRNYYLLCFRSFDQDPYSPTYLEPLNMYIVVFREGTLSFHFRQTPHPHNVRRRIKQLKDYINVTSDWISYALIDDITDAFAPLIQSIEFEVDSIDELVLILKEAEQSDMLRRIGTCRKKVMGLLRLMGNKADVIKGLAKRCNEYWSIAPKSDIGMYLSDIQDHLITMTQNLNHYELILSRSHSNYLAQISIEMTDANNQINDVLSKLTALGTVIVPMNVITGLWGMNVQVPGQNVQNLNWFGGICAVMVVIAVTGYITTVRYLGSR